MERNKNALERLIQYCQKKKLTKIGIPYCVYFIQDKDLVLNFLERERKHPFDVHCVMCSTCEGGAKPDESERGGEIAKGLNGAGIDVNIVVGLCQEQERRFLETSQSMSTVVGTRKTKGRD